MKAYLFFYPIDFANKLFSLISVCFIIGNAPKEKRRKRIRKLNKNYWSDTKKIMWKNNIVCWKTRLILLCVNGLIIFFFFRQYLSFSVLTYFDKHYIYTSCVCVCHTTTKVEPAYIISSFFCYKLTYDHTTSTSGITQWCTTIEIKVGEKKGKKERRRRKELYISR